MRDNQFGALSTRKAYSFSRTDLPPRSPKILADLEARTGPGLLRAVKAALASPHIVQERVEVPSEAYPSWVDGRLELIDRQFDTAPFVTNGEYMEGLLTRLSTAVLLNVTAGGGSTVPTFLVSER